MNHFDQIKSIKNLLSGESDRIILDKETQASHNEYINKKLEYIKTETSYFNASLEPNRKLFVILPEKYCPNTVFKNVRFDRLDLVETIEFEVGGQRIDYIHNENNSFEVFQKIYDIDDPNIIPIGCLVSPYWFPYLSYYEIRLWFKFKNFDPTKFYSMEDFENFDPKITYDVYSVENIHDNAKLNKEPSQSCIMPFVQYTGAEALGVGCCKYKLCFNSLTTHLLFSIDQEVEINKFVFLFKNKTGEQRLTWSKDNADDNNIRVDKIGNYWVVPLIPSLSLDNLQTHGVNMGDNFLHTQFDIWVDKIENPYDTRIYIMCISFDKCIFHSGKMHKLMT